MHHFTSKICLFKHEQKIMTMWSFIIDWIFSCIKKTISSKLLNSLRCNFLLFSSVCVFSALFSSINKKNDDKKSHLHMKTEFLNSFSFSVLHSRTLRHSRDDKRQKQAAVLQRRNTLFWFNASTCDDAPCCWLRPHLINTSVTCTCEGKWSSSGGFLLCLFLEIWFVSIN